MLSGTSHASQSPLSGYHDEQHGSPISFRLEIYTDEEYGMGDTSGLLPTFHLPDDRNEYLLSSSPGSNHLFFPSDEDTAETCYLDFLPEAARPLKLVPNLYAPKPLYPLPFWLFS
jgi:hypothetical protein